MPLSDDRLSKLNELSSYIYEKSLCVLCSFISSLRKYFSIIKAKMGEIIKLLRNSRTMNYIIKYYWYLEKDKVIALIFGGIYLILSIFFAKDFFHFIVLMVPIIIALISIWFSHELTYLEYPMRRYEFLRGGIRGVLRKTPPIFIWLGGWFALLLLIISIIIAFLRR